ncbi:asparaginase [Gordonia westfalica]|uniref:asparaginase n=1 Tax=Gordonia westfalica TaxID=158898 RepID=A0A1H2I9P4_9ACTN|nr:asparaginase [Gordonia westfalica]SDU40823.1 L-asparaginase [Gordonia westfalica]
MAASPPPGRSTTVLITTGGTIAAHTTTDGAVPALGADDLLAASNTGAADAGPGAVRTVDLMSVDSSAMTVAEQFAVVRAVAEALADPATAGVVVTHGTDTMEETAFLVDLYLTDDRPVVFTGAQLPADSPDADGPRNLAAALATVGDPASGGRGVLVVAGGRVLPARGVFKVSTTDAAAFDSVGTDLPRPVLTDGIPLGRTARVDTFALYPGVSPGLIAAAVAQNAAGIVLAATGSGNTHPDITAEVALAVAHGVTVVVASRVPYGEVSATYGGGGGAVDLHRAGAIVSPWLRAPQARMALIALLTAKSDPETIAEFFAASGR